MKSKQIPAREGDAVQPIKKGATRLKTEPPLSEKDEFKKAEEQTQKSSPKK